jgi:tryptophanyl-tRNA synthetase
MAADILLYQTQLVPVGHDQKQHLELTRNIAQRFNNLYGEVFTVPEPYIPPIGARIMGLQDPSKKMSKSDTLESNYIALLDSPEKVRKKIKRAVTDSGSDVRYDEDRPGIANLLMLYASITDRSIESLEKDYAGKGYGDFKSDVAEAVVAFLGPMQERFREIRHDMPYLQGLLSRGAEAARERAQPTLAKVHDVMGLIKCCHPE